MDGPRRAVGVCRGPWIGAPHCPGEGFSGQAAHCQACLPGGEQLRSQ